MSTVIAELAAELRRKGANGPDVRRAIDAELRHRVVKSPCEMLKDYVLDMARRGYTEAAIAVARPQS